MLPVEPPSVLGVLSHATERHQAGKLDLAVELYHGVLTQFPGQFDATHMLGVLALQRGQLNEAETWLRNALRINPQDAAAHYNLATALYQTGRFTDAAVSLKQALVLNPVAAEACALLGATLAAVGDEVGAREAFSKASQLTPNDAGIHLNLGCIQRKQGDLQAAAVSLTRAVELNPNMLRAHQQLALALFELGAIEECLTVYQSMISLPNVDARSHYAFGNALMAAGDAGRAIQHYKSAIELDPEFANARWAVTMAQAQPIYQTKQEVEDSRQRFVNAIAELETWFTADRLALTERAVDPIPPFYFTYHAYNNLSLMRLYGNLCSRLMRKVQLKEGNRPTIVTKELRKIRIGFVSAFIRYHSVWMAITKGWSTHLDPSRFEVHVFHLGQSVDSETEHARREATDFVEKQLSMEDWARAIASAELDALIYPDIGMDPLTTQLAAQRLAPVQAASWGHPETTGLPTIDIFLSAELLEPANGDAHYTEKLVRLPNLGVCVEPLRQIACPPDYTALGLPSDKSLLLCPGQLFKYSPEHDDVWATLGARLQAQGGGKLVFFRSPRAEITRLFEQRLRRHFSQVDVDFDSTVCFIPVLPRDQYYGLMKRATLMLDTIGFSGFNTALQCLECGLPLVAFEGEFMRGRLASALLLRMGLAEWVATYTAEFVDKAMFLVENRAIRLSLSHTITERKKILFNDLEPVRALERVLADAVELVQKSRLA
jgi:predicted O-linked N-acetylglucosamine transferase (SPINDLY family)